MPSKAEKDLTEKTIGVSANGGRRPSILVIGEVRQWRRSGRSLPADQNITYADFDDMNSDLLDQLKPDVVLSSMLNLNFDCLDLAIKLQDYGFRGRYRVIAPNVPDPGLIRAEIRTCCPRVDFDILYLPLGPTAGLN